MFTLGYRIIRKFGTPNVLPKIIKSRPGEKTVSETNPVVLSLLSGCFHEPASIYILL